MTPNKGLRTSFPTTRATKWLGSKLEEVVKEDNEGNAKAPSERDED